MGHNKISRVESITCIQGRGSNSTHHPPGGLKERSKGSTEINLKTAFSNPNSSMLQTGNKSQREVLQVETNGRELNISGLAAGQVVCSILFIILIL